MNPRTRLFLLAMLASFSIVLCASLQAAESPGQREAREADDDSGDKVLPDDAQAGKNYSGRLTVEINDKQPRDVIGYFVTESGATYTVRSADQALLKRLVAHDKQKCVLFGKLRNNGKYLVVSSIVEEKERPIHRGEAEAQRTE